MANSFGSVSLNAGELKTLFEGPVVDQLNEDLPIYKGSEKRKKKGAGQQVNRPLRLRRHTGVGSTTDGGVLPAIGVQNTQQAVIQAKYNYLRFGVTAGLIAASRTDKGAFAREIAYSLDYGYKDLSKNLNRQLSWNGDGQVATVAANVVGSNVISISGRESVEPALKFLDVGYTIDIVSSGSLVAQGVQITAVSGSPSASSATLTLSANVTATANDLIVLSGSYNNDLQGLLYSLDGGTSTIYSIDRSVYQQFQGNVINNSGNQLTVNVLDQARNEGLRRGGMANGKFSAVYSDFDSLRFYQKLLQADRRYVISSNERVTGDGVFTRNDQTYLAFAGIPWVADQDCPQRVFMLPEGILEIWEWTDGLQVASETGSEMIAQPEQDAFEVRVRYFCNFFNSQPSAAAVVRNYISP